MKPPIFANATFLNIEAKSRGKIGVHVELWNDPKYVSIITKRSGNSNVLVGFYDHKKGLYITDRDNDPNDVKVGNKLRQYALEYARKYVEKKLKQLSAFQKQSPEQYKKKYKSYDVIENGLVNYLSSRWDFYKDLNSQIKLIEPTTEPIVNEYFRYKDDDIDSNDNVTYVLPFKNPEKRNVTVRGKRYVDHFLNVFFDDANKKIFSWYMGALVLNKTISTSAIGKYLVISSKEGGVGKSTLMNLLIKGLFTDEYSTTTSDFDQYFILGNRFGANSIPHTRLVVYSEASFQGPLVKESSHDFTGLNDSQIKALATEGVINSEAKFENAKLTKFNNLHVILTNFPPDIDYSRSDLSRRILPCSMRPTKMATEKSESLKHATNDHLIRDIQENGQAFFDYFATVYRNNVDLFKDFDYSSVEFMNEQSNDFDKQVSVSRMTKEKLQQNDGLVTIGYLCNKHKIDYHNFIRSLIKIKHDNELNTGKSDVKWREEDGIEYLYINISKRFWLNWSTMFNIRDDLRDIYPPVKKFGQQVFKLPIKNKY